MYHITERNERQTRRLAMVFAVALHLALLAMLYFKTSSESVAPQDKKPVNDVKAKTTAQASSRLVHQP